MKNNINILLVYGSGGHNEQMSRFLKEFMVEMKHCQKEINLISLCDNDVKHILTSDVYLVPTVTDKFSYLKSILKFPTTAYHMLHILRKIHKTAEIDYVITTGPGIAIVSGIYFKRKKAKIFHIETWSRFYSKSITGRLMYYIADKFFVQNKELLKIYPRALYKGRL